jgi:hypothetical protein
LIGGTYDGEWMMVEDTVTELLLSPKLSAATNWDKSDPFEAIAEQRVSADVYYEYKHYNKSVELRLFLHVTIPENLAIYELMRGYRNVPIYRDGNTYLVAR